MYFGVNKHKYIFQRKKKLYEPIGQVQFEVSEKFPSAYYNKLQEKIVINCK